MQRISWRWVAVASLAAALLVGGAWSVWPGRVAAQPVAANDPRPKLVLAFYYMWFEAQDSFVRRASEMFDHPAPPYTSSDPAVIERQVSQAQYAGIDGFISSWGGTGSETDSNLPTLLSIANRRGFKVSIYLEAGAIAAAGRDPGQQLQYALTTYSHDPAFLTWDNRPVIFIWDPRTIPNKLDYWRSVRQQLDPQHQQIWSVDTTDRTYLDVFDTIHFFSGGSWDLGSNFLNVNTQWRGYVDSWNHAHPSDPQRLWTVDVIPGWDESRVQPFRPNPRVIARNSGLVYEAAWKSAINPSFHPEWVLITSWNEWFEGSQIEPSATYGNRYLDLTRQYVTQWKGVAPAPPPTAVPTATPAPASPCGSSQTFRTGFTVCGQFLDYWYAHGSLAQEGYPISPEIQEQSALDGKGYTVQYFERAVFERHPENKPPFNVLLTQLGTFRYKTKYPSGASGQSVNHSNERHFAETGHSVGGAFRAYWEANGGLAQFGYPISDEFWEVSDLNGKRYVVQYFERAVFEYHPENAGTPSEVLLSQLGTFQYHARYQVAGNAALAPVAPAPAPAPPAPNIANLRFFTTASQGCGASAQTSFQYPQRVYAQFSADVVPPGTQIAVIWAGGAHNYSHTDTQITPREFRPACVDGFWLDPSRYGIGPGAYTVQLLIDGKAQQTVAITVR